MTNEKKVAEANPEWSFRRGWVQLKQKDASACRSKLMAAMSITTGVSFLNRMAGKIEPRISEYEAITRIFAEYGVSDAWGE